jgi:type IV pilus assembly protein PilC
MTSFRYRAVNRAGTLREGVLEIADEGELADLLQKAGLELIEAKTFDKRFKSLVKVERQSTALQREILCGHMADLLRAGLPLLGALRQIAEILENGAIPDALRLIARDIERGEKMADAFAGHPSLFDGPFLALLRAGEAGGDLAATFSQLRDHLRWQEEVSRRLRRALRYPLFLMMIAVATVTFMMLMVVPQITSFLQTIDGRLPLSTRALIFAADLFSAGWLYALGLIVAVLVFLSVLRRQSEGFALGFDKMLLSLPFVGQPLLQLFVARFTETFALLLNNGLPLPEALRTARPVLHNLYLMSAETEAERRIASGEPPSEATRLFFPSFVAEMLRVGEQSGQLPKALNDVTRIYNERVKDITERFIGSLEPFLTLLVGGLLAWVVLAVLGPIYGSLSLLGRTP